MKKKILVFLAGLCSMLSLSSCGLVKGFEHDITLSIRRNGELYYSTTVNIFNNAILPKMDKTYVPTDMKFAGYTLDSNWTIDDGADKLFREGAVIHYKDVKDYAFNDNVELYSQFVDKDVDVSIHHYVAVGWYDQESTSGLNEDIAKKLEANLRTLLINNGATEADLADFVFKGYSGQMAVIGPEINEDGYIDVFIGAGATLKNKGGVEYVDRYAASENYGSVDKRYVYLLRDKPVARLVYEYCDTPEFYSIFK